MVNTWTGNWTAAPAPAVSAPYQRQTFGDTWGYTSPYGYGAPSAGASNYGPGFTRPSSDYMSPATYTGKLLTGDLQRWLDEEALRLGYDNWNLGGTPVGIGTVGSGVPGFELFDAGADRDIQEAANAYGVPANFLKSIIRRESSGDWNANSHWVNSVRGGARIYGYVGVFEDAARSWGFDFDSLNGDRKGQVMMLASGLRGMYDTIRSQDPSYDWLNVANYHFSGNPEPTGYVDELGNRDSEYMNTIGEWWKALDAAAGNGQTGQPVPGQQPNAPQNTSEDLTALTAIWGGAPAELSQGHGRSQWADDHPSWYEYSYQVLGYLGHPGIDVGMSMGTPIYNALPGKVTRAGGTGSYTNVMGYNPPDSGEVRVQLANGDEIIYGHLSAINVKEGDTIPAGMNVGLSGYPAGPHLHLEVRVNGMAVDPRDYFTGGFTGWLQTGQGQQLQQTSMHPMTYTEMLQAVAQGKTIRTESMPGAVSSFNDWLQIAARGDSYEQATQMLKMQSPQYLKDYASKVYAGTFKSRPGGSQAPTTQTGTGATP